MLVIRSDHSQDGDSKPRSSGRRRTGCRSISAIAIFAYPQFAPEERPRLVRAQRRSALSPSEKTKKHQRPSFEGPWLVAGSDSLSLQQAEGLRPAPCLAVGVRVCGRVAPCDCFPGVVAALGAGRQALHRTNRDLVPELSAAVGPGGNIAPTRDRLCFLPCCGSALPGAWRRKLPSGSASRLAAAERHHQKGYFAIYTIQESSNPMLSSFREACDGEGAPLPLPRPKA